jgi:hypothetical protein
MAIHPGGCFMTYPYDDGRYMFFGQRDSSRQPIKSDEAMKRVRTIFLAGLSLLTAAAAVAGEYHDRSGFTFTYPDGWFAAGKFENLANLPPELASWIKNNHIDLNQVAVVLIHAGHGSFLDNLNVVVVHDEMPLDDASIKEIENGLPRQYRSMGVSIENLESHLRQVGSNKAMVVDYRSRLPGLPLPIWQRQYYIPLAGNTYILTCTATSQSFAASAPVFERIVESFSATALTTPAGALDNFKKDQVLIFGVIGGAVFGMIGALVAAWKSMKNRSAELVASGDGRYRGR